MVTHTHGIKYIVLISRVTYIHPSITNTASIINRNVTAMPNLFFRKCIYRNSPIQ